MSPATTPCAPGYTLGSTSKCFKYVAVAATWTAASYNCSTAGNANGWLASIASQQDQDACLGLVDPGQFLCGGSTAYCSWIGLSSSGCSGCLQDAKTSFTWSRGYSASQAQTFENWGDGQPAANSSGSSCGYLTAAGTWAARECTFATSYICETSVVERNNPYLEVAVRVFDSLDSVSTLASTAIVSPAALSAARLAGNRHSVTS